VKIHSDVLTAESIRASLSANRRLPGVTLDYLIAKGSRSRSRSFEFRLEGSSNRMRNSGIHGSEQIRAATWDEHGWFFSDLFDLDRNAIIGPYKGYGDFHAQTRYKFGGS